MLKNREMIQGVRVASAATLGLAGCATLSGCMIAGYGDGGTGSLVWPGSLAAIVILALILWFLCRTR